MMFIICVIVFLATFSRAVYFVAKGEKVSPWDYLLYVCLLGLALLPSVARISFGS